MDRGDVGDTRRKSARPKGKSKDAFMEEAAGDRGPGSVAFWQAGGKSIQTEEQPLAKEP